MKYLNAQEFTKEYHYDEYKRETKKKEREFRKTRKEKRDRWSNTVDL